jgi:hypothetical protein
MSLIFGHWPTPSDATNPLSTLSQTADVLFAWTYITPFALCLPFLLNPPFWIAALSMVPVGDRPQENAGREAPPHHAPEPGEKRRAAVSLSLVPVRRAT